MTFFMGEGTFRCKLCVSYGVEDPFTSTDARAVGQHINDDHESNDIMDWVCFYGNGVEKINV